MLASLDGESANTLPSPKPRLQPSRSGVTDADARLSARRGPRARHHRRRPVVGLVGVMTPAAYVLLVLACPMEPLRDCVAVVAEVATFDECRALYQQIKPTLPTGWSLGFPECHQIRKGRGT